MSNEGADDNDNVPLGVGVNVEVLRCVVLRHRRGDFIGGD